MYRKEEIKDQVLATLVARNPSLAPQLDEILDAHPTEKERIMKEIFKLQPGNNATEEAEIHLLQTFSADNILDTHYPEPVWVVPGLLPNGLSILAGAPKVGKSWLSLQLAMNIATGSTFLGRNVEAGQALVVALEDPPRRLQSRMITMGWPKGLSVDFMALGQFEEQVGNILNGGAEKLARQIKARKYRLVILDTLSRAVTGDQQDVEIMTRMLTPFQEMAHQVNCAILLVDHHRKSNAGEPDAIADILGSTAKGALADTIWGLYRERGKAASRLSVTGRDVVEQNLQVEFNNDLHLWIYKGDANELALTERRQEILNALAEFGPSTATTIAKKIDKDRSNTDGRIKDLVNAGLIRRNDNDPRNILYEIIE